MSDNTILLPGSGGDTIRTVAKTANAPAKTQMMMLDVGGGADGASETVWTGAVTVSNQPVGAASIATSQAAPGTSAASIVAARTGAVGTGRVAATIINYGAVTIFFGPAGVTTSTGFPLQPGASATINTTAAIYAITASGTGAVAVLETF